jgi:DNA modification methylase
MTPWRRKEVIGDCTLYLGDCAEILAAIDPVYAILSDPPYGIGMAAGMGGGGFDGKGRLKRTPKQYAGNWDDSRPDALVFRRMLEISDVQIIWGGNYFADILPASTRWLFWDKINNMPSYSDGELAWTSLGGTSTKKFSYAFSGGPASKRDGERVHPTQKPVALMSWCLSLLSWGGSALDPFMGSGTTGVACVRDQRPFVGIEINDTYFDIACERIADAGRQTSIFGSARADFPEPPSSVQTSIFGDGEP